MSQETKLGLISELERISLGNTSLTSLAVELVQPDRKFEFELAQIIKKLRESQLKANDLSAKTLVLQKTHPKESASALVNGKFFMNNFSAKGFIEKYFGNRIEEGLLMIEKERARATRNETRKVTSCSEEQQFWGQSDLHSFEGCCYALAIYLFKQREQQK